MKKLIVVLSGIVVLAVVLVVAWPKIVPFTKGMNLARGAAFTNEQIGQVKKIVDEHPLDKAQVEKIIDEHPLNKTQIEGIIDEHLLGKPQILLEVGKKLQEQEVVEQKAQIEKIRENVAKNKDQIFDTKAPGRLVAGNPKGKIIVAEFTQHQCPHCKVATAIVNKLIRTNPEVQFITIYWPFFGEDAIYTAKAVFAAAKQNKGEELDQAIFAAKDQVTKEKADAMVKAIVGLNSKKLATDMNAKEFDDGLKANFALAQELGLIGTPSLFFANRELTKFSLVPGQTPRFEEDLVKALNEVK